MERKTRYEVPRITIAEYETDGKSTNYYYEDLESWYRVTKSKQRRTKNEPRLSLVVRLAMNHKHPL